MIFNTLVSGGSSKLFKGLVDGSITEIKENDLKGVEKISEYIFQNCDSLTSVVIPDSVGFIEDGAFSGCKNLTSVTFLATTPPMLGTDVFYETNKDLVFYVPMQSVEAYKTAWAEWADKIDYVYTKGLAYTLNDDGVSYSVSGIGEATDTNIIIPLTYEGLSVTSIGNDAFSGCSSLTSVKIPNSVTGIGGDAFSDCSGLTSVNYTGTIDEWAEIKFSNRLSNPLYYAKSLKINGEVVTEVNLTTATKISSYAFYYYSSLTSVIIGDSVTEIGDSVFTYCRSLTSVIIGDSVTEIGDYLVYGCSSLNYNVKDNLKYLGNAQNPQLYLADPTSISITSANIDNACKFIGSRAFEDCSGLTSVVIPDSVTSIDSWAFARCSKLTSVEIPDSVTFIGYGAFQNCDSLTSIVIPDSVISIDNYVFRGCTSLTSAVIPDSVTSIGSGTFYDCDSLTSVEIPDSVTFIGYGAFYNCASLTSIVIPDSVISIDNYAFDGCTSLTSIVIPDSVTSIGKGVFQSCDNLTSVIIGDSVTSIGDYAFNLCNNLITLVCKAITPPKIETYTFKFIPTGFTIYVPAESVEAYKSATNWSDRADYIQAIEE